VSYEVPAGIIIVVPVLLAKTMSLQGIVEAQNGPMWNWFVFQPTFFIGPIPLPIPIIGLAAFVFYLIAGLAETNRTPFDHVEADSELTGGFTTEYSGMQFSLFFLAEYANAIAIGLLGSALFLGGYHSGLGEAFDNLIWPLLPGVLITKAAIIFLVFVWVRGTLPRSVDAVCVEAHAAHLSGSAQPVGAVRQPEQLAGTDRPARAGGPIGAQATYGIRSGRGQRHADHDQPPGQAARYHPIPRRATGDADLDAWASAAHL
jgi:hypothetical protein